MNPGIALPRIFFAMALIAFGIQQVIFGVLIAGRPPAYPEGVPGELLLAYATGVLYVVTGATVITHIKPRRALIITGIVIMLIAGLRNFYTVVITLDYGGLLTNTCKSFTFGTGAFLIAKTFPFEIGPGYANKLTDMIAPIAHYVIAAFLIIAGVQHFLFADFVKFLIPAFIPWPLFWTYFSGVALVAAGIGIIFRLRLAALVSAYMVFAWVILLHLPRALTEGNQNEWTAVFEALGVSGLLYALALGSKK